MHPHKIISIRHLTDVAFVLRMERKRFQFQAGQFLILQDIKTRQRREYSVYSGENDDYLEVLVRQVEGGMVSNRLAKLKPGSEVLIDGPFGYFTLRNGIVPSASHIWIATGTGISPFHSFARSYTDLNYRLIHGVRLESEAYEHHHYNPNRVVLCTSASQGGDFHGRVTDYLASHTVASTDLYYLCGNSAMIGEVFDLLTSLKVASTQIFSEVYF